MQRFLKQNNDTIADKNASWWPIVASSSAIAIFGGFGCYVIYKHFKMSRATKHVLRQRTLEPDRDIMSILKRNRDASEDLHGAILQGASLPEIRVHKISNLRDTFESEDVMTQEGVHCKFNKIVDDDIVLSDIVRNTHNLHSIEAYPRAGARSLCHFDPKDVKAAVVTCGGLCPGLNNVIREIVHTLRYTYGCTDVIGIRGGYNGLTDPSYQPIDLTLACVDSCHHMGGSILGSSRGGFDVDKIIKFLIDRDINQLYVIGGDGTHRGALALSKEVINRNLNISIAGIPKTIDNDVDIIDRSFGFQTAVEAAQLAIASAKTEAKCNIPNGIGIVKLMGRSAGFIASHATLSSGDVDLCLIPEIPLELEGPKGFLEFLEQRVKDNGHAVVVVAEGAGEDLLSKSSEVDAGGNRKLPPIGEFLKTTISKYFKDKGIDSTVKYIDPSYMIRSVAANAADSVYCMLLGQNAVHGAMAGYTGFTVGLLNNRMVLMPIERIVSTSPRTLDANGRTWERVISLTRQPKHVFHDHKEF